MAAQPEKILLKAHELQFSALTLGEGPVVVCLHGFPDNFYSFREQMPALAEAGFRTISPMLRGYEPSSQPKNNDYFIVNIAKDLIEWTDNLGIDQFHLIGHDWGAAIGYLATALAPQKIISLSLLAVPSLRAVQKSLLRYPSQSLKSWYMIFFQLGGIADYFVKRNDYALLEKLWHNWSPGWNYPPEVMENVKQTFRQPGVPKAALDYYRSIFSVWPQVKKEARQLFAVPLKRPTLLLTGANDGCIDTRTFDLIEPSEFPAGMQLKRIQHAGHFSKYSLSAFS